MIFVDGHPVSTTSSQGCEMCLRLLENPVLVAASNSLKGKQEKVLSLSEESPIRCVYIFQREYATVHPSLVDYVGTDEATTCVGLVIRNRKNGMTSVAHKDSPKIVDIGLAQMLSAVVDHSVDVDDDLDVHLIGGFEDVSPKHVTGTNKSGSHSKLDGYSFPLCVRILEILAQRPEKFHIQTLFILGHNTKRDPEGNAYPIFNGFMVETSSGSLIPARFDRTTRCPDEIVRRIRVGASHEDPTWTGKLLETYETQADQFVIAACSWTRYQLCVALILQHLSDVEILQSCSTSPFAEGPDFGDNTRRQCDYLIKHPDWQYTFPKGQPRIFERTADGGWKRYLNVKRGAEPRLANYCIFSYFYRYFSKFW